MGLGYSETRAILRLQTINVNGASFPKYGTSLIQTFVWKTAINILRFYPGNCCLPNCPGRSFCITSVACVASVSVWFRSKEWGTSLSTVLFSSETKRKLLLRRLHISGVFTHRLVSHPGVLGMSYFLLPTPLKTCAWETTASSWSSKQILRRLGWSRRLYENYSLPRMSIVTKKIALK